MTESNETNAQIQLRIKEKEILEAIDTSLSKTKQNTLLDAMSKKRRDEFLELSLNTRNEYFEMTTQERKDFWKLSAKKRKRFVKKTKKEKKGNDVFLDPRLSNYKLIQKKNGTQLINKNQESEVPLINTFNEKLKDEDLFRQLNSFLKTEEDRKELKIKVKTDTTKDSRFDNFKISSHKLIYKNGKDILHIPITEKEIQTILGKEYQEHGAGKGILMFYKRIQSKYLAITRQDVTEFLKSKQQYVLSRPTPHKTNKPIIAKSLNEIWSIDLIDMERPEDTDTTDTNTDEITGGDLESTRASSRNRTLSAKVKDNNEQSKEKIQEAIDEENKKKADIEKREFRWIFTCVDVFSRKVWLVPMKGKSTEFCTKPALMSIIKRAGVKPRHIMVDNGTEFMANFEKFCKEEKIKIRRTRTYSPKQMVS